MSNRILFVYDNLKVTIHPGDAPYYGFEILAGEVQCSVIGTLYDLGQNAGYHQTGNTKVRGQIWTTNNSNLIQELKEFAYPKGNVCLATVHVTITEDNEKMVIPATTFALEKPPLSGKVVDSGYWIVKSYKLGT
jgi:gamma-glutamylcyclotransferase (GGCT)/AIG2-like uncharacterized protein YtfP